MLCDSVVHVFVSPGMCVYRGASSSKCVKFMGSAWCWASSHWKLLASAHIVCVSTSRMWMCEGRDGCLMLGMRGFG